MTVALVFVFWIWIAWAGYESVTLAFTSLRRWAQVILAIPVGSCLFIVYGNMAVHLLGYATGVWGAVTLLTGHALVSTWRRSGGAGVERHGPTLKPNIVIVGGVIFLLLGVLLNLDNTIFIAHDSSTHGTIYSQYQIYGLSFPVDTIYTMKGEAVPLNVTPGRLLYHFGYDLFNSMIVTLTAVPVEWAYWLSSAIAIFGLLAMTFLIASYGTGNLWVGIASMIAIPCAGYRFPVTMQHANNLLAPADGTYIIFSITIMTAALFLACRSDLSSSRLRYGILIALLAAAGELVNESYLVTAGGAIFFYLLFLRLSALPLFLAASLVALVPIYWFGGIVGGLLRGDSSFTYSYPVGDISLRLKTHDLFTVDPFYGHAFPVYAPNHLLANPLMPLLLVGGLILCALHLLGKRKMPPAAVQFGAIAFTGYAIPGIIDFGYPQNVDAIRFVNQSCWAWGPAVLALAYGFVKDWHRYDARSGRRWSVIVAVLIAGGMAGMAYPDGSATYARLFFADPGQRLATLRASITSKTQFTGALPPGFHATAEEYDLLMKLALKRQKSRNVLCPDYSFADDVPEIYADAGETVTTREKGLTGAATITLDADKSRASRGSVSRYTWRVGETVIARGAKVETPFTIGKWDVMLEAENEFHNRGNAIKRVVVGFNHDGMENVALASRGSVAGSNGTFPGLSPQFAIDGSLGGTMAESWVSSKPVSGSWWRLTLPRQYEISRVVVRFRNDYRDASQTSNIVLSTSPMSDFSEPETLAVRGNKPFPNGGLWVVTLPEPKKIRALQIANQNNSYLGLAEVEAWHRLPEKDAVK